MNTSLSYNLCDGVATITIDDGKANVMSVSMLQAIDAALTRAEADKAVVVMQGRVGMFSGGFDLAVFRRDPQEVVEMLTKGARLIERMLSFPYPLVVVCTGHAIAMGAFLLLGADLRIGAQPDAKIQVNEVQIGMVLPHFAIELCRQRLSPVHVVQAAALATPYRQQQAIAPGFLDEVIEPASLAAVLTRHTAHLLSLHKESFAAAKLRLREPSLALLRAAIAKDIESWSKL